MSAELHLNEENGGSNIRIRKSAFSIDSILSQKMTIEDNNMWKTEDIEFDGSHDNRLPLLNGTSKMGEMTLSRCTCNKCQGHSMTSHPFDDLELLSYTPYYNINKHKEDSLKYLHCLKDVDNHRFSKRRRTIFTSSQLERLEYEFQQQQYIVGQERRYLARQLGLNEIQVKVWFQNRRIKWRKFTLDSSTGTMPDLSL